MIRVCVRPAFAALCSCASVITATSNSLYAQVALDPITIQSQSASPPSAGETEAGVEQTTAGPVDGYRALTATSATKTNTPVEQIPQSIQVIPRSLIEDQQALTVEEALRNVSNVQGNPRFGTPAYDQSKIRGFAAEQWLDGITVYYAPGDRNSLINVERIEVLKGPSALLYGGGAGAPPGGAINIVSKLPTDVAGGEFGITVGSNSFVMPFFDINQPLNKEGTALFRITGQYGYSESFIDVLEQETYDLNPTLTLTNKKDTSLILQGRFSRWEQPEYQGLPATGTVAGDFRIDRDLFIGPSDIPDSYSQVRSVTATLDHSFDPIWSFNLKARYSETEFDEKVQTIVGGDGFAANIPAFPGTSLWALANAQLFQEQREFTVNPNLIASFSLGQTKNTLLFGADYSRLTDKGFLDAAFTGTTVDLENPSFPTPYSIPGAANRFSEGDNVYVTQGIYTQLQTTIWDRLHVTGGLRLANVNIESVDTGFGFEDVTDKTKLLPRIGAVVDLVEGVSVFAGYSEGLKGNPFVIYSGAPLPEESEQVEAGVKLKLAGGLSGTLAVFEIERSNVPVADPATGGLSSIAAGQQRSRGFEADLLWQPTANWQFLASYAYVDAVFTKDVFGGAPAGNKLNGVPEHSGRLWANYSFENAALKGWSVGAGIYLASEQFIDNANLFTSDATFTLDAKIAYETAAYRAAISVNNITDEDYFIPYEYFGGRVAPAEGRTVLGTLTFKY